MKEPRTSTSIKAVIVSVLMILMIIVVAQNTSDVKTTVLFRTISMPLALLLGITLATGMLFGGVLYHRVLQKRPER